MIVEAARPDGARLVDFWVHAMGGEAMSLVLQSQHSEGAPAAGRSRS
jgi:hypothetical protein